MQIIGCPGKILTLLIDKTKQFKQGELLIGSTIWLLF